MSSSKKSLSIIEAAAIIVGQIVGIGIFFKNGSIFKNNNNNPWGVIISWIVGGFLALCICMSLAKLASIKQKPFSTKGFGQWNTTAVSNKFGNFTYSFMNMVYYPVLFLIICIFAVEPICQCFSYVLPFYAVCLISLGVVFLIILFNFLSHSFSRKLNPFLGYMKFIPLVLCLIATILVVALGKIDNNTFENLFKTNNTVPDSLGILNSLPAILFAYNGYLVIGNITEQIENPEKKINKIILIGILSVVFIYVAVAILMIFNGAASGKILQIFGTGVGLKVMSFVLFFVAMCSVLLFGSVSYSSIGNSIKDNQIAGSKFYNNLNKKHEGLGTFAALSIMVVIYFAIFVVPSIILNSDSPLDTITNSVSYTSLIILSVGFIGMLNKKYKKLISDKFTIFQYIILWVSIIVLLSVLAYSYLFYTVYYDIRTPMEHANSGIFYDGGGIPLCIDSAVLLGATVVLAAVPLINLYIINRKGK